MNAQTDSVIPPQHRVLWVNCIDLIWSSLLSKLAAGKQPETEPVAAEVSSENSSSTVAAKKQPKS
jgi:Mpv17 / PMP22 family